MFSQPNGAPRTRKPLKSPLLYSSLLVGIVLLIVAWILFSRWDQDRSIERRNRDEASRKQRENDRVALEQLGGKELGIQVFYASPSVIHKGETVQLCYGVANAKTVRLEPQANAVWPSHNYCVNVFPATTTIYTLTITDGAGNRKSQSLDVRVR